MVKPKLRKRHQLQMEPKKKTRQRNNNAQTCLLPVLPVPLFLYNSGEYFYQLFSKYRFFSSFIVENTFFNERQKNRFGDGISSHPTILHHHKKNIVVIVVAVGGSHFSFNCE